MAEEGIKMMKKVVSEVKCVALGEDVVEAELVEVVNAEPMSTEQQIANLEERVYHLTNALDSLFLMVKELRDDIGKERDGKLNAVIETNKKENKIEIPEGTVLTGKTKGLSYFMHVKDGGFYVGITRYDSLSAAAEGISGVRRSGWTFWRLPDGKTVKETFKG
jgi:uncharacterized coiled-coil protein SlyX